MPKINLKLIITLFIVFLILLTTFCFAADTKNIMLISDDSEQNSNNSQKKHSDLYVSENNQYDIKNIIEGNVFSQAGTLNIDSSNNGGIINGNLYATAGTVNIKSNVKYSETEKDEFGNYKLEDAINTSKINGNVFITANKFVLEPACEINGDLYICANQIELSQNATINGNVFVMGNKLTLNSRIDKGSLYATVKDFNMQYYGFIFRDLYLSAETATIEGYVYRNSFIKANDITTTYSFINNVDLKVYNASNVTFSGEVKGNANISSKNIVFKSKDANTGKNINCKIYGNLDYSSKAEIQIEDKIVLGNINYSKYKDSNSILSVIGKYIFKTVKSLVCVFIIYIIINRFASKYINKLSSIDISKVLVYIGIGIAFIILIPIVSIILLITKIGSLLALLLILIYFLILLIAKPIFIISIASIFKNRKLASSKSNSSKEFLPILVLTAILSLISFIPYVGFIVSLLIVVIGLGLFIKTLVK